MTCVLTHDCRVLCSREMIMKGVQRAERLTAQNMLQVTCANTYSVRAEGAPHDGPGAQCCSGSFWLQAQPKDISAVRLVMWPF